MSNLDDDKKVVKKKIAKTMDSWLPSSHENTNPGGDNLFENQMKDLKKHFKSEEVNEETMTKAEIATHIKKKTDEYEKLVKKTKPTKEEKMRIKNLPDEIDSLTRKEAKILEKELQIEKKKKMEMDEKKKKEEDKKAKQIQLLQKQIEELQIKSEAITVPIQQEMPINQEIKIEANCPTKNATKIYEPMNDDNTKGGGEEGEEGEEGEGEEEGEEEEEGEVESKMETVPTTVAVSSKIESKMVENNSSSNGKLVSSKIESPFESKKHRTREQIQSALISCGMKSTIGPRSFILRPDEYNLMTFSVIFDTTHKDLHGNPMARFYQHDDNAVRRKYLENMGIVTNIEAALARIRFVARTGRVISTQNTGFCDFLLKCETLHCNNFYGGDYGKMTISQSDEPAPCNHMVLNEHWDQIWDTEKQIENKIELLKYITQDHINEYDDSKLRLPNADKSGLISERYMHQNTDFMKALRNPLFAEHFPTAKDIPRDEKGWYTFTDGEFDRHKTLLLKQAAKYPICNYLHFTLHPVYKDGSGYDNWKDFKYLHDQPGCRYKDGEINERYLNRLLKQPIKIRVVIQVLGKYIY